MYSIHVLSHRIISFEFGPARHGQWRTVGQRMGGGGGGGHRVEKCVDLFPRLGGGGVIGVPCVGAKRFSRELNVGQTSRRRIN